MNSNVYPPVTFGSLNKGVVFTGTSSPGPIYMKTATAGKAVVLATPSTTGPQAGDEVPLIADFMAVPIPAAITVTA